eukprot:15363024-Ditylum_brightwellii.AAC.1
MERSKQNKHVVCNKHYDVDNDVDNYDDNDVDNSDNDITDGVVDGDDDGDDGVDKQLTHISQSADCCLMERSNQNKHVVCNKDNDVNNDFDNGDDGVDNDDDGIDVGNDGPDKHLTHLSQADNCCLMERSKQNKH